jgi:hypothetical protein
MSDEYEIERKRFWRFIVDAYLNLDDDLIKTMEGKYLMILNLDAEVFIKNLDEIIEDNEK